MKFYRTRVVPTFLYGNDFEVLNDTTRVGCVDEISLHNTDRLISSYIGCLWHVYTMEDLMDIVLIVRGVRN